MLPSLKKVVLDTGGARLLVMDTTIGSLVRAVPVPAHVDVMILLATRGSDDALVSGS